MNVTNLKMNQGISRLTVLIIVLVVAVILFIVSNPFKGKDSKGPTPTIPPLTAPQQ